jgi:hypothetical protein
MNADQVSGGWKQLRGHVGERWGPLPDDDPDRIVAAGRDAPRTGRGTSPEPEEFEDDPVPDEEDEE